MTTSQPLCIGILGSANIARAFTAACAPSQEVTVAAVASRGLDKAEAFAREVNIPRTLGSYEDLLIDPGIDAVYVPLPNSMHAEWAIRAVEAGKHVLCEKPLALNASDARAMFDAARMHQVKLREGYPYLAQAQTAMLSRLAGRGRDWQGAADPLDLQRPLY